MIVSELLGFLGDKEFYKLRAKFPYWFRQSMTLSIRCFALTLSLFVLFVSGCATPVGVKHVDEKTAYRALGANVLSSGAPSAYSTQLLERNALSSAISRIRSRCSRSFIPAWESPMSATGYSRWPNSHSHMRKPYRIGRTTFHPPSLHTPFCFLKIQSTRPTPMIRAFGSLLICTTRTWLLWNLTAVS